MSNRWKLALALLILLLGVSRGWEALNDWQAREPWIFDAVSSLVYLIGAGLIWRDSRGRGRVLSIRTELLHRLSDRLEAQPAAPVLRVAVDGAGKTTFADELAGVLRERSRRVIRASVDGFHAPRVVRYRRGRGSPEGFYRDSYDLAGLRAALLGPLGPGGSWRYRTAIFDHVTDAPLDTPELEALSGSILILDGLFLHRPELRDVWDDSVFLHVPFEVSVPRGAARGPGYGSPNPHAESNRRYVEGNRLYFREADPYGQAGVVVDNTDLEAPFVVRASPSSEPRVG